MKAEQETVAICDPGKLDQSDETKHSFRVQVENIKYFLGYLKPDRYRVLGVILLSLVSGVARLPLLYLPTILTSYSEFSGQPQGESQSGYDIVFWSVHKLIHFFAKSFQENGYFWSALTVASVCILLLAPLQLIRGYWSGVVGGNLLLKIRTELFGNLQNLSMLSVYEKGAAPFVQRMSRDMFLVHDLLVHTLSRIVNLFLQIVVFIAALFVLDPRLTIGVVLIYILMLPLLYRCNQGIQQQAVRMQMLYESITNQMIESIGGFRDIVAVGHFDKLADQFRYKSTQLRQQSVSSILWSEYGELVLNLVFGSLTIVPYFLLMGYPESIAQLGRAITCVGLLAGLLPALAGIWGTSVEFSTALPSMNGLRDVLQKPHLEPFQTRALSKASPFPRASVFPDVVKSIRFDGVGLQMEGRWIIRNLNFEIDGGGLTAIIGQSGAGKTTIFHLLLRLIQPTCGTIWINDTPLNDLDERDLHRFIGFIPQNPFIFNTSLKENLLIASARPELVDMDDIVSSAQLKELIESRRSEGGLEAYAGYLGMRLSGGERQRIALGRLLVQNPKVVICDEYTANVDIKTAQLVEEMVRTRFAGKARLMITHELYTVRGADRILVLDQGEIVQSGTHKDLVGQPGLYQLMWQMQHIG